MFDKKVIITFLNLLFQAPARGLRILETSPRVIPGGLFFQADPEQQSLYEEVLKLFGNDKDKFYKIVRYLDEHDLIETYYDGEKDNVHARKEPEKLTSLRITAKGADYLSDDGGLGAELNITTIRVHTDTLLKLEELIKSSNLSDKEKEGLFHLLKEKGIEAFASKCMESLFTTASTALPSVLTAVLASFK